MSEYLTTFASILDELFKQLADCGLLTTYTVQLQSNLASMETMLKFRTVIQELIRNLQSLLSSIPSVQSVEASTQTLEETTEVVVTCHPISIATLAGAQLLTPTVNSFSKDIENITPQEPNSLINSEVTNESKASTLRSIEICELKPLLLETTGLVNLQDPISRNAEKDQTRNIVHIVVEASNSDDPGCSFPNGSIDSKTKIEEQIKCTECKEEFNCRKELKEHFLSQHKYLKSCNLCDEVFSCLESLQEHCRSDHDGTGCLTCSVCSKQFTTKLSHNRHIDTHKTKKEAVCNICGKAFSRADYLQIHYSIHLGKRNFACSQCPRKFVRSIHLRAHEKIHSGIKDHICKMCNKGFVRSDKLKEHVLRHLNIKRFQCKICHRDYAEKRDLKVHLKSHSKC